MVTSKAAVDIAEEAIEAFNAGNWAKLGELLAEDVTYTELAGNTVLKGREQTLNHMLSERGAFPDFHARIVDILPGESKVGLAIVFTGTHTGEMVGPAGTFLPTGKQFNLPAFLVFIIKDGKIVSMANYSDNLTFLQQLGLIPESFLVPA